MLTTVVRTLKSEFHVHAPDKATADALAFIDARPEVEGEPPRRVDIAVEPEHGFLRMMSPEGGLIEGSTNYLLANLHRLHYVASRSEYPETPMVHGGAVTTTQGHAIFVGEKGAGKTTLLLYLASLGWPVAGDEHVLIDGFGTGIPRPGRCG